MSERRILDIATKLLCLSASSVDRTIATYKFIDQLIMEQEQKGECTPKLYELRGRFQEFKESLEGDYNVLFKQYSQYVDERQS